MFVCVYYIYVYIYIYIYTHICVYTLPVKSIWVPQKILFLMLNSVIFNKQV